MASRSECWPSLITPSTATPRAARSAATSRSRPARSPQADDSRARASSPDRQSRIAPRDQHRAEDRQNDPALALQRLAMRRRPGRGGDQFIVALEQDAAFADRHAAPGQLPMDLRDAAMLAIAQGA